MADIGRPTVMDQNTLNKLEEVFALGGTDKEACLYAGISHQTLYNYQEKNPDFVERKEALKATPVLKARRTIDKSLSEDVNSAWKLVERRDPDLNPKQVVDHQTKGEKVENIPLLMELAEKLDELYRKGNISGDGAEASSVAPEESNQNV